MLNIKVNSIVAGAAFILSFLVGIISGATIFIVFIRALVFGAVSFAFVLLIHIIIDRFLPELLQPEQAGLENIQEQALGSHVNISVEDREPKAQEERGKNPPSSLDQQSKREYTKEGRGTENPSGLKPSLDALPEASQKMSDRVKGGNKGESPGSGANTNGKSPRSQNKETQYNPKQMASVIQTILKQE
jgi:hypothetical protein